MMFTTLDKKYEKLVKKVEQRKQDIISREQKGETIVSQNVTVGVDDEWFDLGEENLKPSDEDTFKSPTKIKARLISVGGVRKRARKVKGRTIKLDVPVNILHQTAVDAARLQITPRQHPGSHQDLWGRRQGQ